MIIALEGPDCCGKTTLFNALQGRIRAVFVPKVFTSPGIFAAMSDVSHRDLDFWEHLYDSNRLYICDRHASVSGPVYNMLRGDRSIDVSLWTRRVVPIVLNPGREELLRRFRARRDDNIQSEAQLDSLWKLYIEHCKLFKRAYMLNSNQEVEALVQEVLKCV